MNNRLILQARAEELCQMMLAKAAKTLSIDSVLIPLIDSIEIMTEGPCFDLHVNKYTVHEDTRCDDIKLLYDFVSTHSFRFVKGYLCDDTIHVWLYDMSINDTKTAHQTERITVKATEIDPVRLLTKIQADLARYSGEEN